MKKIILTILFLSTLLSNIKNYAQEKPTICILGGIPSTTKVLELIPESVKNDYNFISFNRPGFGGNENDKLDKKKLIQLAKDAGLQEQDFGIIGISAGAPMAMLLAQELKIKNCGVISGMVTREAFLKYADLSISKPIVEMALQPYSEFEKTMSNFPNLEGFISEAGAKDKPTAIRAFYDELNFIFSSELSRYLSNNRLSITWWHPEKDKNVPLESVKEFLGGYSCSDLHIIPDATHDLNLEEYIQNIVNSWD